MTRKIARYFLVGAMLLCPAVPSAFAGQNRNSSAKQEFKGTGKETGRAGKSLGHNVRHGRVVRGGKHFGKHMGRAGKHLGKGTAKTVKKVVKP